MSDFYFASIPNSSDFITSANSTLRYIATFFFLTVWRSSGKCNTITMLSIWFFSDWLVIQLRKVLAESEAESFVDHWRKERHWNSSKIVDVKIYEIAPVRFQECCEKCSVCLSQVKFHCLLAHADTQEFVPKVVSFESENHPIVLK